MSAITDSAVIRARMDRIRGRMHTKVDRLKMNAGQWFDWRYHVVRNPLSSALVAGAVGYWLMPGRRVPTKVQLDEKTIENLVSQGALRVEAPPPAPVSPWWVPLGAMVANYASRAALAYLTQQVLAQRGDVKTPLRERV